MDAERDLLAKTEEVRSKCLFGETRASDMLPLRGCVSLRVNPGWLEEQVNHKEASTWILRQTHPKLVAQVAQA